MANLDTMLPIEEDPSVVWEESSGLLPGLEDILRSPSTAGCLRIFS